MKKTFKILILATVAFLIGASAIGDSSALVGNHTGETVQASAALLTMVEKKLYKGFRHEGTWLSRIPSKNQWVNNDVIKLNEIGADPTVLINNNTYPIAVNARTDNDAAISLYKYDTENTSVTQDEIYALPYDKEGSVQVQHRETIEEKSIEHALHSLSPMADGANTPVMETTGANDGTGRKRLTRADLINFKKAIDGLKIPMTNRILVLSPEHVTDLLLEDEGLVKLYHNHTTGAIAKKYYGFDLYETLTPAVYDVNGDKKAFGAATVGTDRTGSVFMYTPRTAKAKGSVKAFLSKAEQDPEYRMSKFGVRMHFIALPLFAKHNGAIIDAAV